MSNYKCTKSYKTTNKKKDKSRSSSSAHYKVKHSKAKSEIKYICVKDNLTNTHYLHYKTQPNTNKDTHTSNIFQRG